MVIAAAGALSACATSNTSNGRATNLAQPRFMVSNQSATPPSGFIDFCARSPQDCGLKVEAARIAASTAATPPPHGGYDWRQAFAAGRGAAADQVGALRQELYGRYMWKAAFEAAKPVPAPETPPAPPAEAAEPSIPFAVFYGDNAVDRLRGGLLTKASYSYLPRMDGLVAFGDIDVDPALAGREAGAAFEPALEAVAEPAAEPAVEPAPAVEAAAAPKPLALTPALLAQLTSVDRAINGRIIQTEDLRAYGQDDYWATPLEDGAVVRGRARGDCEDFALEKRRALIAVGVPAEALSIAVANTRWGPHAVLLVDTDGGEMVLDSLNARVTSWTKTGYQWVKRQAWGDPMSWVAIAAAD